MSIDLPPPPALSFTAFVLSLAQTAAVHFGDRPDVSGAKGTPNLPAAGQIIDILALLEVKTRGNLTVEERRLLEELLAELRQRHAAAGGAGSGTPSGRPVP